jgi:hypothetical protein
MKWNFGPKSNRHSGTTEVTEWHYVVADIKELLRAILNKTVADSLHLNSTDF